MKRVLPFVPLIILLAFAPAMLRADTPGTPAGSDNKPWKNQTELSYVGTNGNTKSQTLSAKDSFSYTHSKTTLELFGGLLSAEDKGVSTAENYNAGEKVSYKLSDRNYTYERVAWDKDRFSGVKSRWDSSLGFGRELIKTERNALIAELGGGYLAEDRYNQPSNNFTSGRAYAKYTYAVSPTSNFSQDAEYLHNFDDPDDFRAKTETALTAAVSKHFSMKASYVWKYVGVPPPGFGRNDTITGVALVAAY